MKIVGDVAFVPLSKKPNAKQRYAVIDAEDAERVDRSKWYAWSAGRTHYALATSLLYLPKHHKRLHMFVMKAHPGQRFDHVNNDGLDCRKVNLREATGQQNSFNTQKTAADVSSKFKGVMLTSSGKWAAHITKDGEHSVLGVFEKEADAARAYDAAADRLFGEFARTNASMGLFDFDAPQVPRTFFGDGEFVYRPPDHRTARKKRARDKRRSTIREPIISPHP